jgi:hypothetical protein
MPGIVEERYINGLKLLDHYFNIPDKIQLIDNSGSPLLVLEKTANVIKIFMEQFPGWVRDYLGTHLSGSINEPLQPKNLSSADEVRALYKNTLRKE